MDGGNINQALTSFLLAVIGLATVAVTVYVIPWLKAHATQKQIAEVERIAGIAVSAAEKMGGADGKTKLANALQRARDLAEEHGLTLDGDQWRTLIESAVKGLDDIQNAVTVSAPQDSAMDVSASVVAEGQQT